MKYQILAITFLLAHAAIAKEKAPPVLSQKELGVNACGPCSVVNSLLQAKDEASLARLEGTTASEKARYFGEQFGKMDSVVYGKHRTAYSDANGTADRDLLAMVNQLRDQGDAPKLEGTFLLRREDEIARAFTQRVREIIKTSLAAGVPPLLSIRSVKAEKPKEKPPLWNGISGHWLCVVGMKEMDKDVSVLRLADSITGEVITALLYSPSPRKCVVPLTFDVDEAGKEKWHWEEGRRCMFISCPVLPLGTQRANWHERTYIAARYLIAHP